MSGAQLYDTIGTTYAVTRRTEPRIAAQVWAALGDARTVVNVGAGTGSYEPPDRDVTAVEPSAVMRERRRAGRPPRRAPRSRISPSTPQWHLPPFITGRTRSPGCARCGAWLAAWSYSRTTPVTPDGTVGSGLAATTCPRSLTSSSAGRRWPRWPARSEPARSRCSFRGTALTASSRPTGAGPRHTSTIMYVAEYRCGPEP